MKTGLPLSRVLALMTASASILLLAACATNYEPVDQEDGDRIWSELGGEFDLGDSPAAALPLNYADSEFTNPACSPLLGLFSNVFHTPEDIDVSAPQAWGNLQSPTLTAELGTSNDEITGALREDYFGAGLRLFPSSEMAEEYSLLIQTVIEDCPTYSYTFRSSVVPGAVEEVIDGTIGSSSTDNGFIWTSGTAEGVVLVSENLIFGFTYPIEDGVPAWAEADRQLFLEVISRR